MRMLNRILLCGVLACQAIATPPAHAAQRPPHPDPIARIHAFALARMVNGSVPAEAHLRAFKQRARLQQAATGQGRIGALAATATATQSQWISLGPSPAHFGGSVLPGDYSGKVDAIVVDPRDSNVVYVGTDSGGVWKSVDGGANWRPLTDSTALLGIGALALDPSNPNVIYAGTGGDFGFYLEAGVIKSTDGGATWTNIAAPFLASGRPQFLQFGIDPNNSQVVLAATDYGIWRSTDAGLTWTHQTTAQSGSVIFDPHHAGVAYYTQEYLQWNDGTDGLYRSSDSGATWAHIGNTGGNAIPPALVSVTPKVYLDPTNSQVLYYQTAVTYFSETSGNGAIYKSIDGGGNWTPLPSLPPLCCQKYVSAFAVNPTNPNILYSGIIDLYRSMDGGTTWSPMFISTGGSTVDLHPDHHALAFSADGGVLYEGNDGGVFRTTFPAAQVYDWQNLNGTLATLLLYPGLSVDPSNSNTSVVGTQDNGTLLYQGASAWNGSFSCGDGGYTAIDPTSPTIVFIACANRSSIYRSAAAGVDGSFVLTSTGIDPTDRIDDPPPLAMDPNQPGWLYFGTYRVYQTMNGGLNWQPISPDLTLNNSGSSLLSAVVVAPSDSNVVYAASFEGHVQVTTNASAGTSATWQDISGTLLDPPPPGQSSGPILSLAADPLAASTLYVGIGSSNTRHLFMTSDRGVSWASIGGGLPDSPLNTIVVDPDQPGALYVGTDVGAFWTADAGAHWQILGQGLPNVIVTSLVLQRSNRVLRAGTFGRSAWDLPLPALPPPVVASTTALSFGSQVQGSTSGAQTLTLSNTRRTDQSLASFTLSGDYAMSTTCGTSLPVGASCNLSVTFTPQGPDARPGQLNYVVGGTSQSVVLSGTGTITALLSSSSTSVTVGQSVSLTWAASDGATCTGSGGQSNANWNGALAVSGTLTITEGTSGTFTYVLSCRSGTQSANTQVSVTVMSLSTGGAGNGSGGGGALDILSLTLLLGVLGVGVAQRRHRSTAAPCSSGATIWSRALIN